MAHEEAAGIRVALPAIPPDVCSVRERLKKLQEDINLPLRFLLKVNLQAG